MRSSKLAVMKYGKESMGKNFLFTRPKVGPKQCKARWFRWLDPSIKKTEWTREEDEKLFALGKVNADAMAHDCAHRREDTESVFGAVREVARRAVSKDEEYDPMDDPRRLRPGD